MQEYDYYALALTSILDCARSEGVQTSGHTAESQSPDLRGKDFDIFPTKRGNAPS